MVLAGRIQKKCTRVFISPWRTFCFWICGNSSREKKVRAFSKKSVNILRSKNFENCHRNFHWKSSWKKKIQKNRKFSISKIFIFIEFSMKISMKIFDLKIFGWPISKCSNFVRNKPFWSRFFSKLCRFSWRRRWHRNPCDLKRLNASQKKYGRYKKKCQKFFLAIYIIGY